MIFGCIAAADLRGDSPAMSSRQMRAWQVSVPLPVELRVFVEREAERGERSVASVVRELVARAAQAERAAQEVLKPGRA
jgi:hypothetical protein